MTAQSVVIVGGGLAGMAAAEALSRIPNGPTITLLEAKRKLGGRAGSFADPDSSIAGSGETIDYCQHAAMGCCTNFIDLLDRCGLQQHVRRYSELTFLHPKHRPSRFAPNKWLPAPLHLLGTLDQQRYLPRHCRREIKRGLWKLMRTPTSDLQQTIARNWLKAAGQSDQSIQNFWDVILVSALGEQTDRVSMATARKVMIDGFAVAHGASDILVPSLPLSQLFGKQMAAVLTDRGIRLLTGQPVLKIEPNRTVVTANESFSADHIVCAVPWHQISRLMENFPMQELPGFDLDGFTNLPPSPITGVHLWWDRPITDLDHAVMVGTLSQWLFRNPVEAAKKQRDNQHYTQVVVSASAELSGVSKDELIQKITDEICHAFPLAREARLLRHRIVSDPNSVFSIQPEVDTIRPSQATELPWFHLAGDWTATGWPATMEGAVISGRKVANAIAKRMDITYLHEFLTPPLRPGWLAKFLIR